MLDLDSGDGWMHFTECGTVVVHAYGEGRYWIVQKA